MVNVQSESNGPVAHATGGRDGRECGGQGRNYYFNENVRQTLR